MKRILIITCLIFSLNAIIVGQLPCIANFSYSTDTLGQVSFMNLSNDLSKHFYWDFGDGTSSNYINPIHFFPSSGEFLTKLYIYDSQNNCSDAYQDWLVVTKYDTSKCDPYFTDTIYKSGGNWVIELFDNSINCFIDSNIFHITDAGPAYNGAFTGPHVIFDWGRCNFIGDNRYTDTNYTIFAEYTKSLPVMWDINKNYFGCSANFEVTAVPTYSGTNGMFVTFKAMNQNLANYNWESVGFGNPIYLNTSYAYFNYPIDKHYDKYLVVLTVQNNNGNSDTVTQQILIRYPWQHTLEFVNKISNDINIVVYPNPTSGNLNISFSGLKSDLQIKVYNIQGKEIHNQIGIIKETIKLDLSSQAKGVYFIRIWNDDFIRVEKVVVQ